MLVLLIILGVYVFMDLLLITIFCVRHKVNPFTRLKQAFDMLFNKKNIMLMKMMMMNITKKKIICLNS